MTLWPMALMPMHSMPGMSMTPLAQTQPQAQPQATSATVKSDDKTFQAEVFHASDSQPVVVLIHGGCEKCATAVPIFDRLAAQYKDRVKFVRVNEDLSPATCKMLQVKECPAVFFVRNGNVTNHRLDEVADEAHLRSFIDNALKD